MFLYSQIAIAKNKTSAFSLVELSIVLVILGLLTGGILTGQSLIRAAELRAVTTEFNQWQTVVGTFKGKYFALPGDMNNATQFWGSANGAACLHGESNTGTGTQTCNGDGDGSIKQLGNADRYVEMFMFWQHLSNAGLINGTYTGKSGSAANDHALLAQNVPRSGLSSAGWSLFSDLMIDHLSGYATTDLFRNSNYNWPLIFGGQHASAELWEPVMSCQEVWNIDKKIDDGHAMTGFVVTEYCSTSPANYDLTSVGNDAAFYFRQ